MEPPTPDAALSFLKTGKIDGAPADLAARRAYLNRCLRVREFKEKAWPHFACFVDASNVARRKPVPVHEVNTPKARLADLDAVVDELRRLKYVPFVVSDGNLFQLIDRPYEWQAKYTKYPHSVAERRQADSIVLRALRELPEAACVTNDRFSKPDEARDFPDVLALRDCFYRHSWADDIPTLIGMPDALTRLATRLGNGQPSRLRKEGGSEA
ncbi:MAG TPA: hypothetical protein VM370_06620 [Candidatus Thermoplasmatota archaeon]|nr:hypothetical protein [Candidatus Thermoplasmatota archaeon]